MTEFESIAPDDAAKVLIIPFEDPNVVQRVRARYPSAEITELGKQDLAGRSVLQMVRVVRGHRPDLTVVSIFGSTVNRTPESAELLCGVAAGRHRILRTGDEAWHNVTQRRLLFFLVPRLLLSILWGGVGIFLLSLIAAAASLRRSRPRRELSSTPGGTILLFRADVAGRTTAGGSISHIKGVVKGFQRLGYRVVYVADARLDALPASVTQEVIPTPAFLGVLDEFQQIWFNFQLFGRLPSLLRRYRPVLLYQRHAVFHVAASILGAMAGIPFVLEANGSEVWAKQQWSRLVFARLARLCESVAGRWSQEIVTVSEAAAQQLDPYGAWSDRIRVVPNGVDPEEFHPNIDGLAIRRDRGWTTEIVVGFIGTFTRWHGVETLVEAALRLVTAHPDIRFLLIGDGALKTRLESTVVEAGQERKVQFAGLVPHDEAPRYLSACDILVAPHLGFEGTARFFGSPTKLFEYMAMGKPIVASDLEQIGEIIRDGENGLTMQPGNSGDLERGIERLRSDAGLRTRLGGQARLDVINRFTWDHAVRKILDGVAGSS